MPVSDKTYEQVALEDPEGHWELDCGYLRRKPGMTAEHYYPVRRLAWSLSRQLDIDQFAVATDNTRLRVSSGRYYVPDLCVIPVPLVRAKLIGSGRLEVFDEPMPLVVEVWSPSTGDYDVDTKFPEYRRHGDREIWRLHPSERTLTRLGAPTGRHLYRDAVYRRYCAAGGAARCRHRLRSAVRLTTRYN